MLIREVIEPSLAAFVRGEIAEGCTGLSEVVSRRIDLTAGRFFLLMPPGFEIPRHSDPAATVQWNWTPKHLNYRIADSILVDVIAQYLKREDHRVVIQDYWFKRTEPGLEDDQLRAFFGEEQYWELHGAEITREKIADCAGEASEWPWLGYFCKVRESQERELEVKDFEEVADRLVGVAIQALHDSYVFWWRADLEAFPRVISD